MPSGHSVPVFEDVGGGVTAPTGFSASGVHCGLKPEGRLDLALVDAGDRVPAAAVFTINRVAAAPVVVSRRHIADGHARAVVINAGNANACTGEPGESAAIATARALASTLACDPGDVIVCSTGVIGVPLPVDLIVAAVPSAARAATRSGAGDAAAAIMTTDTFAKQAAVAFTYDGARYTVAGMAKGSGMIRPDMATMLGVLTTDAPLTSSACDAALRAATTTTFNRVTVDGDTSTNDTVVLLANGAAGGEPIGPDAPAFAHVAEALRIVSERLARMLARDGEGATKLVTVTVTGASTEADAELAAFAIADSPLVKTALFGGDANWGRVAMAAGKSGAAFDQSALAIRFAGIEVCSKGTAVPFDEEEAAAALAADEVSIAVDLGAGSAAVTVLTCDLSYDYVRINGDYRS
ncbi:MAG: bifunctional glutamate N-acetyltransferase/amino-acid acetyltransferase ArgJ [Coriobacteriia bacterium]|nr:bifunctional glutamate N-acetyltransferase/amino-acid acetyltransferase ArgJ [Coriobacteriia bacterium]